MGLCYVLLFWLLVPGPSRPSSAWLAFRWKQAWRGAAFASAALASVLQALLTDAA